MKIACSADIHSHAYKEFNIISPGTGNSRLDEIISGLVGVKDYCLKNGIKHVLIAGDMFQKRGAVETVVFNSTYDAVDNMSECGLMIWIIAGNHDQANKKDKPENSLHAFKKISGVTVIDEPTMVYLDPETPVWALPYNKNGEKIKELVANPPETPNKPILLAHLGVSGAFVGVDSYSMQDYFTVEDLHPDKYQYGVLGHYHHPQNLADASHFFYCGSPLQNNFNDEGNRGFMVIDTNKRFDMTFVDIPAPRFITIENYEDEEWDLSTLMNDYVRFMVTSDKVQDLLTKIPEGLRYKIIAKKVYEEVARANVKIGMSFEQIVSNYANEFNPEALQIGLDLLKEVQNGTGS